MAPPAPPANDVGQESETETIRSAVGLWDRPPRISCGPLRPFVVKEADRGEREGPRRNAEATAAWTVWEKERSAAD